MKPMAQYIWDQNLHIYSTVKSSPPMLEITHVLAQSIWVVIHKVDAWKKIEEHVTKNRNFYFSN
jgi:hypothetical protein